MKTFIHSYYSEVDFRDTSCTDGFYCIEHADDIDIKKEIATAYVEVEDDDNWNWTSSLEQILKFLIKVKKLNISYEVIQFETFDCDYGNFEE